MGRLITRAHALREPFLCFFERSNYLTSYIQRCSTLCKTCKGPLSTDCIICGAGRSSLNGQCVPVDSNGVCTPPDVSQANTTMVANNAKNECDTCPSTCTACQIPGFSVASTIGQAQCTKCLPGYVLSGGRCVGQCPTGSFVNPNGDGFTCIGQ
jgi:hypothetical protein